MGQAERIAKFEETTRTAFEIIYKPNECARGQNGAPPQSASCSTRHSCRFSSNI